MGRFLDFYRKHIAGTQSDVQLYVGFMLFFAGFVMGLSGILVAIFSEPLIPALEARIEFGTILSSLGLVLIFFGIELTLPARTPVHLAATAGAIVCIVAVFQFIEFYPDDWRTRGVDRSTDVIGLYTLGLMILVTTTALALVVNFVSRHATLPGHELDDIYTDSDRPVTMEEILRDIEREVGRQNLTWGGVSESSKIEHRVKIKAGFGPGSYVRGSAGKVTETPVDEASEFAYTELMRLRGREGKGKASEDDTQRAVDALVALKRARQEELERSWWYRFKRWLVALFTGPGKTVAPQSGKRKPEKRGPGTDPAAPGGPEEGSSGTGRRQRPDRSE
ncbi:MAG: hypothetical protein KY455_09385 [Euryarchaeota archaeon]|nr:hypothetical protein [Euryarchaeota archaeon]